MFKGLSNLASMISQARNIGDKMQTVQEELKHKRAWGRAGGDMVQVEVNGLGQVLQVKLDPQFFRDNDQELLEDLLPAAFNDALAKSKELHLQAMESISGGLDLSSVKEMMSKFTGDTPSS
jgi:nucleoid-associated protein EbfC